MRSDSGWASAQVPTLVFSNQQQKPTYVAPAVKASEAERLRADIEAFLRNGGQIQQLTPPSATKHNGREA